MPARAAHVPDAAADAPDGDEGLRAAGDLHALALAGLTAGPQARRAALAVLAWLNGEGADGSLEAALGLAAPGRMHARQRLRIARRDAALRRLWHAKWPGLSAKTAAGLIASHWQRYAASAWPRHRDAATEPTDEPDAALHRLLAAGHNPLAAETIRGILGAGQLHRLEPTTMIGDLGHERSASHET